MKSLLLFLFSFNSFAGFMYSTGTYVPYFAKAQVNNNGSTKTFELNPYIGIGKQLHMSGHNYFMPELGYSYFFNNPSNMRREQIFLHYNFSRVFSDSFIARYGLTSNWYRIIGKGGNERLKNGTGSTSFPSPDETRTSYYTTLNFGGEAFYMSRKYSIRFDLNIMSFSKLEDRAFNYLLTLNFY